jgi:hypothetical protein
MELKFCVSEKHGRITGYNHSSIPGVTFRPYEVADKVAFCDVLTEYWAIVNEEDLSKSKTLCINGHLHVATLSEEKLYFLLHERCDIQLAIDDECGIIGFLVYHNAYNCILTVECLYVKSEHRARKLAKGLINSLMLPIKKLLFQSRKENPPREMLSLTKERDSKIIHETDKHIAWEMSWYGIF